MRFSTFATAMGLAAIASAQNSTVSAAVPTSVSLTPEQVCINNCGTDICCQARCVNVPCPNELQANATTECAAQCPQGNGSQSETEQYAQCQQNCISSLFFPLSAGATPAPTGSDGSPAATTTGGSNSGSARPSSTASGNATAASPSPTGAAPQVRFGAAGAGLLGLIVAGLAL